MARSAGGYCAGAHWVDSMSDDTCDWIGENKIRYTYKVLSPYVSWNAVPGNYIFVRLAGRLWYALYIGETENLWKRLTPSHEKWRQALDHGMTHIHAHVSDPEKSVRMAEERNLIRAWYPPLND